MFVVTLPKKAAHDPMIFAKKAQREGADVLEIRGDLTPEVPAFVSPLPLIVSPRRSGTHLLNVHKPQYVDLEIGEDIAIPTSTRCIRSFHNFEKTPPLHELMHIAERCEDADIIKIATTINSYKDLSVLDALYEALPRERVILGMGIRAHSSRMLSPFRNALTYTYLDGYSASAPGQVPLSLHRKTVHCRKPKIFGILGSLSVKSGSPLIHNTLFERHNIDAIFTAFLTDDLADALDYIKARNIRGLSVTTPFKREITGFLDELDPLASELQSVNTVVYESGKYKGYNKDAVGIHEGYDCLNGQSSVAIIGSGGVVPAVIHACRKKSVRDICVYARNAKARDKLSRRFSIQNNGLSAIETAQSDVLICAVNEDVSLPMPHTKHGAHAIDLRYGKETRFLMNAKKKGYKTHDGVPMLLHQALEQFQCFTGIQPTEQDLQFLKALFLGSYGKQ